MISDLRTDLILDSKLRLISADMWLESISYDPGSNSAIGIERESLSEALRTWSGFGLVCKIALVSSWPSSAPSPAIFSLVSDLARLL